MPIRVYSLTPGWRRWWRRCVSISLGGRWHVPSSRWIPLSALHPHHVVRWCWTSHSSHCEPSSNTNSSNSQCRYSSMVSSTRYMSNGWSWNSSSLYSSGYLAWTWIIWIQNLKFFKHSGIASLLFFPKQTSGIPFCIFLFFSNTEEGEARRLLGDVEAGHVFFHEKTHPSFWPVLNSRPKGFVECQLCHYA